MKRVAINMSVIHQGQKYAAGYLFDERLIQYTTDNYKSEFIKIEKPWTFSTGKVERMIKA